MTPQEMQAGFELPFQDDRQFAYEQESSGGIYESEPQIMFAEETYYEEPARVPAPEQPPAQQTQQSAYQQAAFQQEQAFRQQQGAGQQPQPAPQQPVHQEQDPHAFRQQWEQQQLAEQRFANQQKLEQESYQVAIQQVRHQAPARGPAPQPYPVQSPRDLNQAYFAQRKGFWIGVAVGAGSLLACMSIKRWLSK